MANTQSFPHDPRVIAKVLFDRSKFWWGSSLLLRVIAAGLGIAFVLLNFSSVTAPWILSGLALFGECSVWRSDLLKCRAEQLKRNLEFYDGLGWPLSTSDISDTLARMSAGQRAGILKAVKENYYASQLEAGPKRAAENLRESSWWSKDLSGKMLLFCALTTGVLLLASIGVLGLAIAATKDSMTLENVSRMISAIISLIVSLGLIRLTASYYSFNKLSEQIEQATNLLLGGSAAISEIEIVKLMHAYQIARSSAPLIPDWIWKVRRPTLNELWGQYRQGQ